MSLLNDSALLFIVLIYSSRHARPIFSRKSLQVLNFDDFFCVSLPSQCRRYAKKIVKVTGLSLELDGIRILWVKAIRNGRAKEQGLIRLHPQCLF